MATVDTAPTASGPWYKPWYISDTWSPNYPWYICKGATDFEVKYSCTGYSNPEESHIFYWFASEKYAITYLTDHRKELLAQMKGLESPKPEKDWVTTICEEYGVEEEVVQVICKAFLQNLLTKVQYLS